MPPNFPESSASVLSMPSQYLLSILRIQLIDPLTPVPEAESVPLRFGTPSAISKTPAVAVSGVPAEFATVATPCVSTVTTYLPRPIGGSSDPFGRR